MHSGVNDPEGPGFPIQKSQDQCSVTNSPGLIAGSHVFHRLSTPRHPPYALIDLVTPTRTRPGMARRPLPERIRTAVPERRHEHPSPVRFPALSQSKERLAEVASTGHSRETRRPPAPSDTETPDGPRSTRTTCQRTGEDTSVFASPRCSVGSPIEYPSPTHCQPMRMRFLRASRGFLVQ